MGDYHELLDRYRELQSQHQKLVLRLCRRREEFDSARDYLVRLGASLYAMHSGLRVVFKLNLNIFKLIVTVYLFTLEWRKYSETMIL